MPVENALAPPPADALPSLPLRWLSSLPLLAAVVIFGLWFLAPWQRSRTRTLKPALAFQPAADPATHSHALPPESCTDVPRSGPVTLLAAQPRQTLAVALQLEVDRRRLDVLQPGSPFALVLMLAPGSDKVQLPAAVEHGALWVAREALNNGLRSGHHSDLVVHLHTYDQGLRLEVHDSSTGLLGKSTSRLFEPGWPRDLGQHVSLQSMRDRCATMGARLTVRCDPFSGTRIILRWLP
jgi:hypothetical protein